jgi:hypothetical protein
VHRGGDGYGEEDGGASEVSEDEDGAAADAVDPGSGEEPEDEDGGGAGSAEDAHLQRGGVQGERRGEGQRGGGDARTHLRDGLSGPQLQELAIAPQPGGGHLDRMARRGGRRPEANATKACIWVSDLLKYYSVAE